MKQAQKALFDDMIKHVSKIDSVIENRSKEFVFAYQGKDHTHDMIQWTKDKSH